jgi:hypothetical protein
MVLEVCVRGDSTDHLGTSGRHRKQSKLLQCNDYRCRAKGYAAGCLIVEEQVGFDRF